MRHDDRLCHMVDRRLPLVASGLVVLFEESDVRAWIKALAYLPSPAAGRRKDADRGTGS